MVKAEFHIHTRYSKDSVLNKFLILIICKIKRIKLLAITDHNEIKGAIKYSCFLRKYGIEVIVGEEIMTNSGEIIGLYLDQKIEPGLSVKETIKLIKKQDGLVYIPHPYDEKRYKTVLEEEEIKKNKKEIDFIEVHNGRNIKNDFSIKQNQIAEKYKLRKIIGSDAHTFFELGRNYIMLEYTGKEKLKKSVENGKMYKSNCINLAHLCTKVVRLIKIIEKGDLNGLYRIVVKRCKRKK